MEQKAVLVDAEQSRPDDHEEQLAVGGIDKEWMKKMMAPLQAHFD